MEECIRVRLRKLHGKMQRKSGNKGAACDVQCRIYPSIDYGSQKKTKIITGIVVDAEA